jgi:hypothetical protein
MEKLLTICSRQNTMAGEESAHVEGCLKPVGTLIREAGMRLCIYAISYIGAARNTQYLEFTILITSIMLNLLVDL